MKKIKLAYTIAVINTIFFLVYNTYFGWNYLPISEIEKYCDNTFNFITKLTIAIFLLPILDLYEQKLKEKNL